ncbi:hypothetical protein CYY_000525 [Polysphondylium violaceum]|uniref:Arginine deiminase n=1 Tax=Polysphondylium violaceum TaxID=133409 RepID=A0A8J4Q1L0_9MYCE|nr:hypothetical protein CYY_000525 [Polysphondylium violaceum]
MKKSNQLPKSSSLMSLSSIYHELNFNQVHENDTAQVVILNEPSLPQWMGSIHPNGSLYEEPLDISKAQQEHMKFRELLEKEGCTVYTVREILTGSFDQKTEDIQHRVKLEDFAFKSIIYKLDDQQDENELGEVDKELVSDQYKKKCIESMSNEQLVEVILTRPTIKLRKSERDTELLATEYSFKPLVNLVFQRDQQITTARGIVMANLSSPIRSPEVQVMKLCFQILGLPIVGEIPEPGKLEGGDFYPCGEDLCFIGVGLRSNFYAVQYMMDRDWFGTERVAVVKDYFDVNQQRMHLDTVCNLIDEKVMLILEDICGEESPMKRLVDEYVRDPLTGKYSLNRHDIEYSKYLIQEGFDLVYASDQNQKDYGCNGLNIGNGKFIVVDKATAKTIARSTKTNNQLLFVDFRTVTKMYGSVHCCSQVISRKSTESKIIDFTQASTISNSSSSDSDSSLPTSPSSTLRKQPSNGSDKIVMVAPTYFVRPRIGSELMNAHIIRQTRQAVLDDFSKLHNVLTKAGIDIHLFCHEPFHRTDQAVFVSEWFSTHDNNTLVIYPLASAAKRRERRSDILNYAFLPKYTKCLDFTPCENGDLRVIETTVQEFINNHPDQHNSNDTAPATNGEFLNFSGIVLDRKNKIAYCSIDDKVYSSKVVDLWATTLGYKVIKMKTSSPANSFLFVGEKCAIFCPEALSLTESETVLNQLYETKKKVVVITQGQMESSCAKVVELKGANSKVCLVMSDKCFNQFTKEQIDTLTQTEDTIIHCDLTNLESVGGHGLIGMIGQLL